MPPMTIKLLIGLSSAFLTACAGSSTPPSDTTIVSGYPIDRTLDGLLEMPDLDVALLTSQAVLEPSFDLDDTDAAPEIASAPSIVTPGHAQVQRVLFGRAPSTVNLVIGGGRVGNQVLDVSDEISPPRDKLTSAETLLLVGQWESVPGQGRSLELWFAYSVDEDGVATSLMSSGSNDPYPSFDLAEYEEAIGEEAPQ